MPKIPNVVSAEEAVSRIRSGSTLAINSFAMLQFPDDLAIALEKRFLETGEPGGLTLWNPLSGGRGKGLGSERFGHEGLLKKVVMSHWLMSPNLIPMALQNKFEAYNLPLGVMSHLIRAAAGRKPGIVTPVGLKTFCDPRYGGGKLNAISEQNWVELMTLDGEEYLFYRAPKIDVAFVRGTTADPRGNITMEKEATFLDALSFAQAAKANGGMVICQVERLTDRRPHPKAVKIPGFLIDYITVAPNQITTRVEQYNPSFSGEVVFPREKVKAHNAHLIDISKDYAPTRRLEDWVVARRAALELRPDAVVNLGFGLPELVGATAQQEGVSEDILLTIETGPVGGVPAAAGSFGATLNPEAIVEQAFMFDSYDGGALDLAFIGAAEVDESGSVNASKFKNIIAGVGGFINITQNAKKVVFVTPFRGGKGLDVEFANGALRIRGEGNAPKFRTVIGQINFSGEYARKIGQEVLYVTERCVFQQTPAGLMLTEIAPGIDVEKDICGQMEFRPAVADDLRIMDPKLFTDGPLGIRDLWEKR
jgi:propionate CoA-transferase